MKTTNTERAREISSLLLSIGIHAGVLLALSVVWMTARTPPLPEAVEVTLIELPPPPAPVEGEPRPDMVEHRAPQPVRSAEPIVEYRVRVVERFREPPAADQPTVAEVSGWEPAVDLKFDGAEAPDRGPRYAWAGAGPLDPRPAPTRADPAPDELEFHLHDHGSNLLERILPMPELAEPGGATEDLIRIIQKRIDAVTPLVHRTAGVCRNASGMALIRFVIGRRGYPIGYQVLVSSGDPCLDRQIDVVLHLAEPYPYVSGWIPAHVDFTLPGRSTVGALVRM